MALVTRKFEDFAVGDSAWFQRRFSVEESEQFAALSGDRNPLHHDPAYAAASEYGRMIVPVHLATAPLSRIAGKLFPGTPSLCLNHEVRAVGPMFYDDCVTYSARIAAISLSQRVLSLDVIAFRGLEILLEGKMTVTARVAQWEEEAGIERCRRDSPRTAFLTGADGAVGCATALRLARAGWNLMLHYDFDDKKALALAENCRGYGVTVSSTKAALHDARQVGEIAAGLAGEPQLGLFVHSASPPVEAPVEQLVAVNFSAFRDLSEAALPGMLRRQRGGIIFLGSAAIQSLPKGWDGFVAAKSMGTALAAQLDRKFARYGIHIHTVAPGWVRDSGSSEQLPKGQRALLPEEVAEFVCEVAADEGADSNYFVIEPSFRGKGRFAFVSQQNGAGGQAISSENPPAKSAPVVSPEPATVAPAPAADGLAATFISVLGLRSEQEARHAQLGITPGWDSLRHFELLLEIERRCGVQFSSSEMDKTISFAGLQELVRRKSADLVNSR